MTESNEKRVWVKEFYSSIFGSEMCHFWANITQEDTKHYWLLASKRMGYDISFLDDGKTVCIEVPTNDITRIIY